MGTAGLSSNHDPICPVNQFPHRWLLVRDTTVSILYVISNQATVHSKEYYITFPTGDMFTSPVGALGDIARALEPSKSLVGSPAIA
jgi:hypothetical protein